jgi:hypothetical protein
LYSLLYVRLILSELVSNHIAENRLREAPDSYPNMSAEGKCPVSVGSNKNNYCERLWLAQFRSQPILGSVTMARLIANCNLSTLGYMSTSVAWRVGSVLEEKRKVLDGGEEGLLTYIICVHPSRICKVLLCESCLLSLTETL